MSCFAGPRSPVRAALAVVLAAALCAGAQAARAEDTGDARKEFRRALRSEAWQERREAYLGIADYDGAEVAEEVLSALVDEPNPAVVLVGVRVLGGFKALDAQEFLATTLRKGRGARKRYVLLALAGQRGDQAIPILLETVRGKDAGSAAQAALALGQKRIREALPDLLKLLKHKDWQVRAAGARALHGLATPPSPKPKPGEEKRPPKKMPVPDWMKEPEITEALIAALASSRGSERGAIVAALEAIHEREYGNNPLAWKAVLAGEEPDARTLRKRVYPPHVFGIPIYGRRVVFVLDNSLRTGDPHRFGSGDRLLEVCKVPGGRDILGMRLRTVKQFAGAHFKRCISDLPTGTSFELITFNEIVTPLFGRLQGANAGTRKLAMETIDALNEDNGIASFDALTQALDISGAKDSVAWRKGPDEIVFVTCNMPTAGEIKEADVVAAAIALKARLRMVPIHTIGIESHPYDMLRTVAQETGGVYRNYYE